jgi:uncharacterized alkaline shock family protein YloU
MAPPSASAAPDERGTLHIDDRVVQRVASYAVTSVEHSAAAPRRVLGINVGQSDTERPASVSATVHGNTASVAASIAVAWPQPIAAVADRLRQRVREEVERSTGIRVDHIDVEVTSLDVPATPVPRVR